MTQSRRHLSLSLFVGLFAIAALSVNHEAAAQSPAQQEAIESAREELGSGANPWYDTEKDSLRK